MSVRTKLDTGADNASISTKNPEFFVRDGVKRVRFQVTNQAKETATFEQAVTRTATIKRHNSVFATTLGEVYPEIRTDP